MTEPFDLSARGAGLVACTACTALYAMPVTDPCRRCGAGLNSRKRHSLQRTWAFLVAGIIAYVPANIEPVMLTDSLTEQRSDSIMSGVLELVHTGSTGVAAIVFFASICIPVSKFVVIIALATSLQFQPSMSDRTRHRLHRVTELIGRWSMIDVFVIAVLTALIQLGKFMTIMPGVGINLFAASVVLTMLSASSLDSRLFWDQQSR